MYTNHTTKSFAGRLRSMLAVDRKRMLRTPLFYILIAVSLALPVLILVMTTLVGDGQDAVFTNAWQVVASVSGEGAAMDMTAMTNINLLYFLIAVLVAVFVSADFKSGYAKNLFTVRAKKGDYVASKTIVCAVCGATMLAGFCLGTLVGGAVAGLSLDPGVAGIRGVTTCMLAKIALAPLFVAVDVLISVVAKDKTWLSVLGSLAAGALLFTTVPLMTPLDAGAMHLALCLAGGAIFSVAIGVGSKTLLQKSNIC